MAVVLNRSDTVEVAGCPNRSRRLEPNPRRSAHELERLRDAGCDDVLLFPCSAELDQPGRLAGALDAPAREA
jgi:hypothetical protein